MIWLIGNKGMLGTDVEESLKTNGFNYFASDKEIDITEIGALRDFASDKEIAWIVNCSAYTAVDRAEGESDSAFRINALGVLNIAKIAKEKNAKLIHLSTDYVFDGSKEEEYLEDDKPNPAGIYGKSKLEGEMNIINNLAKYFIIRISWLYGKNGNNFVYTMLKLFKDRDEVKVVSDQWGSPTYSKDVADVIVKIITDDSDKYGIYHFTNEGRINWHKFASEIYNLAKKNGLIEKDVEIVPITTEDYPTRAKRPENSYLSKVKIRDNLGIQLKSWQDALEEFILNEG